jgi:hypothetical protein
MDMTDISNIHSSKVINDPWPHKVIKNVLSQSALAAALKIVTELSKIDKNEIEDTLWIPDIIKITGLEKECDLIVDAADAIIKELDPILECFEDRQNSKLGYFNNPRFGITVENADDGELHDEPSYKVMSLVIYLSPDKSIGTLLYRENNEDSFAYEIEWAVNNGLLFCTIPNKTWHKYITDSNRRFTLNFYFEKLESLDMSRDSHNIDHLLWLYDQFDKGKLIKTIK